MKIVMILKNGHAIECPNCTESDFEMLAQEMRSWKSFFTWNDYTFIRKSEIVSFQLIPGPIPAPQSVQTV